MIDYASTPDWSYLFGGWNQDDFISWHKALIAQFGLDQANVIFLREWDNAPLFASQIAFRQQQPAMDNGAFIQYAKDNGFYDGLFPAAVSGVKNLVNTISEDIGIVGKNFNWILLAVLIICICVYFPKVRKIFK